MPRKQSHLERSFAQWLEEQPDIPRPVTEHPFAAPARRWRFDFAWPHHKVAVEVDGLLFSGRARHQTVSGVHADAAKYEAAQLLGWVVYRVPGGWVTDRRAQTMDTLRQMLTRRQPTVAVSSANTPVQLVL